MTKAESAEVDAMWEEVNNAFTSLGQKAMSFLLKTVNNRQVGAVEAADRLLGTKLYSISRQFRFVDLSRHSELKRTLKKYQELEELAKNNPDSEDLYVAHLVADVYPNRPCDMEDMSLFELLAWYECERKGTDEKLLLRDGSFYLRRRKEKPYVIQHRRVNPVESDE